MSTQGPESGRDETIVAVKPPLSREHVRAARARVRAPQGLLLGLATAGLVSLALAVFLVLPRLVEEPASEAAVGAAPTSEARAAPAAPELSPEELARLRAQAEQRLADLLNQQERLEARSAESWGGEAWTRYEQLARDGDDAFLAEEFGASLEAYEAALDVGRGLLERSAEIVDSALAAGRTAFAAGNPGLALEQLDLVLSIDPDHEAAASLRARAERLPEVLDAVARGERRRQEGDLEAARAAYAAALEIDPDWTPAREALTSVEQRLRERRFEALLSEGFAALAREDWDDAEARFDDALAMRPGSAEARDGLEQAEAGRQLDAIALAEARALAFESRELWQRAIDQYEAALETDPALEFAKQGLARARTRADLDAKLERLIEEPALMFDDAVLAEGLRLLGEASAIAEPDTRVAAQVDELARLIALATTPVTVELRSDQMTEVTVYRVGELGTFASRQIEVRPGRYTIIGSRTGYRDVRETITVLPGRDPGPVTIVCEEQI